MIILVGVIVWKYIAIIVSAVVELCDDESEACQITLQVQDYTKQEPIVWRSELYNKHLLLIIIVCVIAPRDVLINIAQLDKLYRLRPFSFLRG